MMKRLLKKILRIIFIYISKLKMRKKNIFIHHTAFFDKYCKFEKKIKIYPKVKLINVAVGRGTYIAPESKLSNTIIGRFCSIGPRVRTISGNHPTSRFVSTHPAFFSTKKQAGFTFAEVDCFEEFKYLNSENNISIIINNDVWIGADVLILEGVNIGNGAIIAAGSVVTKDVKPYEIIGGNPAKIIRKRFDDKQIDFLEKIEWWNENDEFLLNNYDLFHNIEQIIVKWSVKNE